MQKCVYCGRDNPDEAANCAECGTALVSPTPIAPASTLVPAEAAGSVPTPAEVPWSARDAWKCLGMFIVFEFVLEMMSSGARRQFPAFAHWSRTGVGHFVLMSIHHGVDILTAMYFSRAESVRAFLRACGFAGRVSSYVWFAVAVTLALRWGSHLIVASGWARGATTTSLSGFRNAIGLERYFYLAPALMAPFCEELYMRGFFYRAFRGSYSAAFSTVLILGITAATHWSQVHRSWVAAVSIGGLNVLQCFLRERTGQLWECVICHFVFNATGALFMVMVR